MWVLVRLVLAAIGVFVRWWRKPTATTPSGMIDGTPYFKEVRRGKGGAPKGFELATPLDAPVWMSLRREGGLHRWAKRLRLAREHQTGDPAFDDAVFVATDHPTAWAMLSRDAAARRAVVDALAAGFEHIHTDGKHLWLSRKALAEPDEADVAHLRAVHAAFAPLEYELPSRLKDGFAWKALLVEVVVWSVAGYAAAVALEQVLSPQPVHVFRNRLLLPGIAIGVALVVALVICTALLLRRSPRGIAIILEAGVVLLVGMPVASVQTYADVNRAWDTSPPVDVDVGVAACQETRRGGWRRRRQRSYAVALEAAPRAVRPADARVELPSTIKVSREMCDAAASAGQVTLTLRRGRFDHAWFQQISAGDRTWRAP